MKEAELRTRHRGIRSLQIRIKISSLSLNHRLEAVLEAAIDVVVEEEVAGDKRMAHLEAAEMPPRIEMLQHQHQHQLPSPKPTQHLKVQEFSVDEGIDMVREASADSARGSEGQATQSWAGELARNDSLAAT